MRRRVLAVVLAVCLVASCSDTDAPDEAGSTTTTTTGTSPTTDTGDDQPCAAADLDAEAARVFADPADPLSAPTVLGPADIDGDGADELFAYVGAGASAVIVGMAVQEGCRLTRVELESGAPAEFPIGGTIGASSGLVCEASTEEDADLSTYALVSLDGEHFELTTTEYALEGNVLVEQAERLRTVGADDPDLGRYGGFSCGDLAAS